MTKFLLLLQRVARGSGKGRRGLRRRAWRTRRGQCSTGRSARGPPRARERRDRGAIIILKKLHLDFKRNATSCRNSRAPAARKVSIEASPSLERARRESECDKTHFTFPRNSEKKSIIFPFSNRLRRHSRLSSSSSSFLGQLRRIRSGTLSANAAAAAAGGGPLRRMHSEGLNRQVCPTNNSNRRTFVYLFVSSFFYLLISFLGCKNGTKNENFDPFFDLFLKVPFLSLTRVMKRCPAVHLKPLLIKRAPFYCL